MAITTTAATSTNGVVATKFTIGVQTDLDTTALGGTNTFLAENAGALVNIQFDATNGLELRDYSIKDTNLTGDRLSVTNDSSSYTGSDTFTDLTTSTAHRIDVHVRYNAIVNYINAEGRFDAAIVVMDVFQSTTGEIIFTPSRDFGQQDTLDNLGEIRNVKFTSVQSSSGNNNGFYYNDVTIVGSTIGEAPAAPIVCFTKGTRIFDTQWRSGG